MHLIDFLERFEEVVGRGRDRPAIYDGGDIALTYGELRDRAVGAGERFVGEGSGVVCLEMKKSPEYLVSILGAWYGKKAFVPVNPELPEARRRLMKKECERVEESGLAYVIYTSGSTGRPKGVAVGHEGVLNVLEAQILVFGLSEKSRVLWFLSSDFDASMSDVGTALLSGASLFIEDPVELGDPSRLVEILEDRRITHVDLPPALLSILDVERLPATLETVIIGGEPAPVKVVREWAARVRVINCYGPTEATICTSFCECDGEWDRPYIGEAIEGVEYEVEGDGELWIGGVGVARGYVNRPKLTADRFVERGGRRWYRTGDRVRVHDDGRLEFVGRFDRQMKVHGRLIAPEEIEAALVGHADVFRAVVGTSEGTGEGLVAKVEVREGVELGGLGEELAEHLQRVVPEWMVPGRFEWIDEFRLGPTLKIDHGALTPGEALMASIWKEILGVEMVGRSDDFFALGGDSLGVLQMVGRGEEVGLKLMTSLVQKCSSLGELVSAAVEGGDGGMSAEVLRASALSECKLLNNMGYSLVVAGEKPRLFVTGATGFLGRHVLRELLARTKMQIVCLVRGRSEEVARRRLWEAMATMEGSERVKVVCADLRQPQMGLSSERWEELAGSVSGIYHLAADVNLVKSYEGLRAVNVGGTREVLRLMKSGRPKELHYASTLSVFVSTDQNRGVMREDDDLSDTKMVYGGYAQTKWEAEVMVRAVEVGRESRKGIYRLGLLVGETTGDLLDLFMRGIRDLGVVPGEGLDVLAVDRTPVEDAAEAMVRISLADGVSETFHIANQRSTTLGELVEELREDGAKIEVVSNIKWRAKVAAHLSQNPGVDRAATLLAMCRCLDDGAFGRHRGMDLFQATECHFSQDNAVAALRENGSSQ